MSAAVGSQASSGVTRTKTCSVCRQALPVDAFHRRRHYTRSGRRAACKGCTRLAMAAVRERRKAAGGGKPSETARRKTRVRARTRQAIRQGKLVPQACAVCGAEAQAHHPDYERPDAHLHVEWLCALHHAAEHAVRTWVRQMELVF